MTDAGIYVHVPFCRSKCPYCDFYSLPRKTGTAAYARAVADEISTLRRADSFLPEDFGEWEFSSLYIGGGTPTALTARELSEIISTAKRRLRFSPDAEITVEANPSGEGLAEKLAAAAEAGCNRVSFGVQSAVDSERRRLGRLAGRDGVERALSYAADAGIDNVSLDVMLGIPGQTPESLAETLDFVLGSGAPHVSAYILKLEEGTYFHTHADALRLPDDDATAELYLQTCRALEKAGMRHYEISNFCREGFEGRHNMKYWTLAPYLGVGPAAHSFIGGKRFYYPRDLDAFIRGESPVYDGEGGGADERLMLGLRTDLGAEIPESAFDLAEKLAKNNLARFDGRRLTLTDEGMLVSNTIIGEILSES